MSHDELLEVCDAAIERPHFPGPSPSSPQGRACEQCRAEETITIELEGPFGPLTRTMPRPGREHGSHWYETVCPIHGCALPAPPPCRCYRCFPEYQPTRDELVIGRIDAALREIGYRLENEGHDGYSLKRVSSPEAAGFYDFITD